MKIFFTPAPRFARVLSLRKMNSSPMYRSGAVLKGGQGGARICLALALAVFSSTTIFSQCKGFVKKQIPKLTPFIHNGQINSSVLLSGDNAELTLTFYSGQTYRILVTAQEMLGNVYFVLKDVRKKELFNSKEQDVKTEYWDFTVESTQQLIVEVVVPETPSPAGIVPSGCVSILVGFKQ